MAEKFIAKPFTGRRIALIFMAFFGYVAAVNFTMASLANSTFGGVVVENSYVASQNYNDWLQAAERARALGWNAQIFRMADDRLSVNLTGAPENAQLEATARQPLGRAQDITLSFASDGKDRYISNEILPQGRWTLRLEARSDDKFWRSEEDVH